MDYYAVLGVERRANADEIKKAYRRLTLQCHPDRHPDDPVAQRRFRAVNEAYDVLGDATARARYDMTARLSQGIDISQRFDTSTARDLLGNVLGDVFRTRRRQRRTGRDLRYTLSVAFKDAVLGSTHDIKFEAWGVCEDCNATGTRPGGRPPDNCELCGGRGEVKGAGLFAAWSHCGRCDGAGMLQADPCATCKGAAKCKRCREFSVTLPPATLAGAQTVLTKQGEPGRFGGEPGDLRVTVNVVADAWLTRSGNDIHTQVFVSVSEAALGAQVPVQTVDGMVMVDLPRGVSNGTKLRLRGKGVPGPSGKVRGDQMVAVVIETPRIDDPAVREALERLESLGRAAQALPRRAEQRRAWDPTNES